MSNHIWRADITGLRALAVIPVVLYHAFPELIPGGFIGVDIFFVISGFLISGILFRQIKECGTINFLDFYARRIKRILPNLIILFFAVLVFGWFVLLPSEYKLLGRSVTASAFFYQNFSLLRSLGDYFSPLASHTPLLHLWSLAIEEQFYLIFPVVCLSLWKIRKSYKLIFIFVTAGTVLSLASCLVVSDKVFDFYFPLTRFWELGAGIVLSCVISFYGLNINQISLGLRNLTSVLGFVLIAVSLFVLDHDTPFPGAVTLMPVLGSMLLIYSGTDAVINKILSVKPVVFIGLISYSLYLWHWPILSFLNICIPEPPSLYLGFALVISVLVSVLIYVLVENPVRRLSGVKSKIIIILLLTSLVGFYILGKGIRAMDGLPERPIRVVQIFGAAESDWHWDAKLQATVYGDHVKATSAGPWKLLFIGDSHMQQYAPRIAALAHQYNKSALIYTVPGCLMVPGIRGSAGSSASNDCKNFEITLKKLLRNEQFEKVIFAGRFGFYTLNPDVEFNGKKGPLGTKILETGSRALKDLINKESPLSEFLVILDNPWFDKESERFGIKNRFAQEIYNLNLRQNTQWSRGNDVIKSSLAEDVVIIDPTSYFCPDGDFQIEWLKDGNHLRSSYVEKKAVWIDAIFK